MILLLSLALATPQSPAAKHLPEGPQVGAPAGTALASIDDWNGDGVRDYLVGIPDFDGTSLFGSLSEGLGREVK